MKHTLKITLFLVLIFLFAQIIGLGIVNEYMNQKIDQNATSAAGKPVYDISSKNLTFNIQRIEVKEGASLILLILIAILIGTGLIFLLIKYNAGNIWKIWFFLSVSICLTIAFGAFISKYAALFLALAFSFYKIYRPNIYIHNISELFIYGGLAAVFVPIKKFSVLLCALLLILISAYDMYAVWKSKHMIKLAKWQSSQKIFAGLLLPYKMPKRVPKEAPKKLVRVKTAVLGGGDVGFPLIFAGVVMKSLMLTHSVLVGFLQSLIVVAFSTLALLLLLLKAKKDQFYPAMPFISAGCFVGALVVWLINL
jgi:presenilin-like A22 family membrane protease